MLLLDTNIWLERLLGQARSDEVGLLLDTVALDDILMSDFTLHSIGVILNCLGESFVFLQFVQDVLTDSSVRLVTLPPPAMQRLVTVAALYRLDFDDAYQYVVAERENATLVSFDGDFDRTDRGRRTPAQLLADSQAT